MAEDSSRTTNHQRLDEMMVHLTPLGAVVPYTLCCDAKNHLWVASKGGLFKLEETETLSDSAGQRNRQRRDGFKVLFEHKHPFPKKVSPYVQVLHHDSKIIYAFSDDKENTDFRILNLAGEIQYQHFIEGRVQSMVVNAEGDLFMTKQPAPGDLDFSIYRSSVDCPLAWEELSSACDYAFQALCAYDVDTLAVATVSTPMNMYSKQSIKWVDVRTGEIVGTFGSAGKADGQLFFPRSMQRYKHDLLVMDKTGRFQRFNRSGGLVEISAGIDAYIGNGFIVNHSKGRSNVTGGEEESKYRDGEVIVACSGIVQDEMFSWLSGNNAHKGKDQNVLETVSDGLRKIYKQKLYPLEEYYRFHEFHSPALDDPDFNAKPMILLVGQYSTGKTTFIRYLLEQDFPGIRIGPEPTTDRFISVMFGEEEGCVPGNALVVDATKQFRALTKFGNAFLNRFQCSTLRNEVLESVTIIDTPGILSGEKQRIDRGYDFSGVLEWFAERTDRIILLFDAHKLDISDEFKRCIEALAGNEDKIRIVLNKSDMVDHQQLMRVYGALMWSLGKVFKTPEVARVYIGSFWDHPLHYDINRRLFQDEQHDLFADLQSLPRNAALRKLNDLIKRARLAKVHAYIIAELRKQMPSMIGKEKKKKELIGRLDKIFEQLQREHNISPGDFPDVNKMRDHLQDADFTRFNALKPRLLEVVDQMLASDIARLMAQIPKEEQSMAAAAAAADAGQQNGGAITAAEKRIDPVVRGGAFDSTAELATPFGFGKGEGYDRGADEPHEWVVSKERYKADEQFHRLAPVDGKISGRVAKEHMLKSKLPNSVLGKIWKLADVDKDGQLDADEFALACYLINLKLDGHEVPSDLPRHLIPPSKKHIVNGGGGSDGDGSSSAGGGMYPSMTDRDD